MTNMPKMPGGYELRMQALKSRLEAIVPITEYQEKKKEELLKTFFGESTQNSDELGVNPTLIQRFNDRDKKSLEIKISALEDPIVYVQSTINTIIKDYEKGIVWSSNNLRISFEGKDYGYDSKSITMDLQSELSELKEKFKSAGTVEEKRKFIEEVKKLLEGLPKAKPKPEA